MTVSVSDQISTYAQIWPTGLLKYRSFDRDEELGIVSRFTQFAGSSPHCFERTHLPGHFTGSAMVVDETLEYVLLTLHRKLNMWLQLGGHADGDPIIHTVSMREAEEESGIKDLNFLNFSKQLRLSAKNFTGSEVDAPLVFDMDTHVIPARPNEPEHIHYDIRFVIVAPRSTPLQISDESHDLRWFPITEARHITSERSMHRQFDKIDLLRQLGCR